MVAQVVEEEDQLPRLLRPPRPVWLRLPLSVGVRACALREFLRPEVHHWLLAQYLLGVVLVHSPALLRSSLPQRGQEGLE
jgi:hypothetical protein